jgi:hypothetical protein
MKNDDQHIRIQGLTDQIMNTKIVVSYGHSMLHIVGIKRMLDCL